MHIIVTNRGQGDIAKREDFTPERLRTYGKLDYVFVPFWSWHIPAEIYENWEVVMFHMTDLPYGRGASPLQNLIARGHTMTKVTAFKCVEEMDAGPVYVKFPMFLDGTADEIYDRAWTIITETLIPYIIAQHPTPISQSGPVTIFERWCMTDIYDFVRMLDTDYENLGKAHWK